MNLIINAMAINRRISGTPPTLSSNIRLYGWGGQSQLDGRGAISQLPVYLQGIIPRNYYWVPDVGFVPLQEAVYGHEGLVGPVGEFAFRMYEKYPNDLHYHVIVSKGSTKLATHWYPGTGFYYNRFRDYWIDAYGSLKNPQVMGFNWVQGSQDAILSTDATAYEANQTVLTGAISQLIGVSKIIDANIHNNFTPETGVPYYETVRTAKLNSFSKGETKGLLDPNGYPRQSDEVHYTTAGYIMLGNDLSQFY